LKIERFTIGEILKASPTMSGLLYFMDYGKDNFEAHQ
jgi:hypothetical protein